MNADGLNQIQQWFDNLINNASVGGTFFVIGAVATVLLVISLVLDGIFDWLNFGDGPLSLTTIGAFGALFGWVGWAAHGLGAPAGIAALLGAVVGAAGGIGAAFLSRFLQKSTSSASYEVNDYVGTEAIVSLPIPGEGKYGEIALSINGQRQTLAALADEPITRGKKVRIISTLSPSSVAVELVTPTNSAATAVTPEV